MKIVGLEPKSDVLFQRWRFCITVDGLLFSTKIGGLIPKLEDE